MVLAIQAALGVIMTLIGAVAGYLAETGRIGQDEPKEVLRLSYLALLFSGLTALAALGG